MYLAQLGASVIRVDQIGGGPDFRRWPVGDSGASFFWEGMNKGKKSIAIDLTKLAGRELLEQLATAPGENAGLLLTNLPVDGFLAHQKLAKLRSDLITIRIMGRANGDPAVDYTMNCEVGVPYLTGPAALGDLPVNHVLPAWDLLTGAYASFALLAALRHRDLTKEGQEVRIPLTDIAISTIANFGQFGEVIHTGTNRARYGNELFGAFGRDFLTKDRERIMIVAITRGQWVGLMKSLGIEAEVADIETARGADFTRNEGDRFIHREPLFELVASHISRCPKSDLAEAFKRHHVCWGSYRSTLQAMQDPELVTQNPIFTSILHPSGLTYPAPGAPASLPSFERQDPIAAPRLGAHTEEILFDVLQLSSPDIRRLYDDGVVS